MFCGKANLKYNLGKSITHLWLTPEGKRESETKISLTVTGAVNEDKQVK